MKIFIRFFAALVMFSAASAFAHDYTLGSLRIDHPWSRATVAGIPNGVAYFVLENNGDTDDRLLAASSPIAKTVELHTHVKDGEVMRMRHVDDISLPAGETVALEPGGLHVMLMGLHEALEEGTTFPMTLDFEHAGSITVDVVVQLLTSGRGGHDHHHHDHGAHGDHDHDHEHSHH